MVYHQKNGVQIMPFFGKELYMTSIKSKKIKVFTLICLLAAVALAAVRTFMLTTIVEPDTGLYSAGTVGGYVFDVGVLVFVVAMILAGKVLLKKVTSDNCPDSSSTVTVFGSALCAFMYVSLFLYGMYMLFSGQPQKTLFTVQLVLCVPCAVNQLFICAKENRGKGKGEALAAFCAPVLFAVRVIDVFMSTDSQINTSQRSLELLMLCAMMLFYMYEASFLVKRVDEGEKKINCFAKYYVAALAVVVLTCITVVPYLLVSVFWVFEADSVVMNVLECCVMLYAASRIVTAHD